MTKCVFFPGLKSEQYATTEYFYEKFIQVRELSDSGVAYRKTGSGYSGYFESENTRKPRLLHIEDNGQISLLLHLYLKDKYDVESATSGEEAMAMLRKKPYDIIVVDIQLGDGMDGFETSRKIRSISGYRDTPIIALTTKEYDTVRDECMHSMINAYICKPFTKPYLLRAIYELEKYLPIT